nr:PREDICTED: uncharacterized protein LOC105669640 [Linepithema humile]
MEKICSRYVQVSCKNLPSESYTSLLKIRCKYLTIKYNSGERLLQDLRQIHASFLQEGASRILHQSAENLLWPEAIPLKDIEADTIANALYTHWIARFGAPRCITIDQDSQFEARLFNALKNIIGCKRVRTTAYHPQGNGIECSYRTIKTALMCHEESNWIDALPVVLLGIRSAYKDDIKCTPAELVYGSTLRIPGEFFQEKELDEDPEVFVERFREIMRKLRPTPTAHYIKDTSFVFKDLYTCTHVFLRDDTVKKPLKQLYSGPFKILERITDRVFKIWLNADKELVVNTERLKPAYQLQEDTNMTAQANSDNQLLRSAEQLLNCRLVNT